MLWLPQYVNNEHTVQKKILVVSLVCITNSNHI